MLELIQKTREYLDYLEDHYQNVQKAWSDIQRCCSSLPFVQDQRMHDLLSSEIKQHDVSKLSCFEFTQYRAKFFPTIVEKETRLKHNVKNAFSLAWDHHKLANPHHLDTWTKSKLSPGTRANCVHMIVDFVAMAYTRGEPVDEFYARANISQKLPPWAATLSEDILSRLKSAT